jgi:CDP-2,3-bis-(O-geranylgeranyl)-sn-glycerol synthase
MLVIVAQALFFFLPAYIANMFPVIFGKVKWLQPFKKPVDGGRKWGSLPVFGESKTYFGFLVGATGAVGMGLGQFGIFDYFPQTHWLFLTDGYASFAFTITLSFLLGFGSLIGDLCKSFIKRRLGIANGAPFFPFDQLDLVAGGLLFALVLYFPSWNHVLALVILTPLLHLLSNCTAYMLGYKKVWW